MPLLHLHDQDVFVGADPALLLFRASTARLNGKPARAMPVKLA
jgi:hypothetical protein